MKAINNTLRSEFANMPYHGRLWNMNHYAFDRDLVYTTLEECCKANHFIYVLMILTNPNVAFYFEGGNIDINRINHLIEIASNIKIKDMLVIVLNRADNIVVDIDTTKARTMSCDNYDCYRDVLIGPYPKRLRIMIIEQDIWAGEATHFLKCVCRDNHVAYAYAILATCPMISYFYIRYEDDILNEYISLTDNQLIKDAIACVRDLAISM
jgi:hypothetical protein